MKATLLSLTLLLFATYSFASDAIAPVNVDPVQDVPYKVIRNRTIFEINQLCNPDAHEDTEIWGHILYWEPDGEWVYHKEDQNTIVCLCYKVLEDGTARCYIPSDGVQRIEGTLIIR